jgi:hypothetical protein
MLSQFDRRLIIRGHGGVVAARKLLDLALTVGDL